MLDDRNKGNIISENPIIDTEKGTVTISVKNRNGSIQYFPHLRAFFRS